MRLDLYSDVICPWCYLGHRRLEAAIGRMGAEGEGIEVRWRAFMLDPRATAEPRDLSAAIEAKYGPGSFGAMSRRLETLGAEAGIRYRFDRALRVGTFDAHRLILWAQALDDPGAPALVEGLFRAYFTDGANVADPTTLVDLAEAAGFDRDECAEMLASRAWADDVMTDQAEAMEAFVTGVPAVLYNGATVIPGAQDTDTMEGILRRLMAKVG